MFAVRTCNLCWQMSKNKIGLHILFALLGQGGCFGKQVFSGDLSREKTATSEQLDILDH